MIENGTNLEFVEVIMVKEDCPCKKKSCERHGNCDACKAYHAESKRKRPCEREKNAFLSIKHRTD